MTRSDPSRVSRRAGVVSTLLIGIVMAIMGVSGLAKAFDLPRFEFDLRSWTFVPEWVQHVAVLAIPTAEIAIATAWFIGLRRPLMVAFAGVLLCTFTLIYAVHLYFGVRPACGCGGALVAFEIIHRNGPALIEKNVGILAMLGTGVVIPWTSARSGRSTSSTSDNAGGPPDTLPASRAQRAFTLIELLLVIALVGILLAMLFPSLKGVRGQSREVKSLSQLQQHTHIMALYANQYTDFMPYFTNPETEWTIVRNPSRDYEIKTLYFGAHTRWNVALATEFYDGDHLSPVFQSPDDPSRIFPSAGYWYSCTFLANPRFWNPRFREPSRQQWKAVHLSDVTFPSYKGMLIDGFPWRVDFASTAHIASRLGFADGSGRVVPPGGMTGGYASGEAPQPGAMHGSWWPPIHHTIDGAHGRDAR